MGDYASIFDSIPWEAAGRSALQTAVLYVFLLIGLELTGRRVFAEQGPQDLLVLLLVAEACDLGLTDQEAGYWGAIASVLTIFFLGGLTERIPALRRLAGGRPMTLFGEGRIDERALKKGMIDESDLEEVAREYGLRSYREFETMVLEGNGHITGVLKAPPRAGRI